MRSIVVVMKLKIEITEKLVLKRLKKLIDNRKPHFNISGQSMVVWVDACPLEDRFVDHLVV